MKLLFDQNLSRFLVDQIKDAFPDSAYVAGVDLDTATDREVWEFAGANGYIVVSKDSDFNELAFVHGPPPKVVWLRVGNASTAAIRTLLLDATDVIAEFAHNVEDSVLILPAKPHL